MTDPDDPGSVAEDEAEDETVPWRTFLAEAEARLRAAGIAAPEQEARWIVERASGNEGADFLGGLDEPATRRGVMFFDRMLADREDGEPLQYVLGRWAFRSLDLLVDQRVLIPRPETEQVVDAALAELDRWTAGSPDRRDPVVVDLGTGSGAIGLSIAVERGGAHVWLTDVSPNALAVAGANLAGIGRAATRVRLVEGSWFDALPAELRGGVALLVSNPPYVGEHDEVDAVVRAWEPAEALWPGPTGYEALEALVDGALEWLAPDGALVVELAPHQAATIVARATARGLSDVAVGRDLAGRDRWVVARRPG